MPQTIGRALPMSSSRSTTKALRAPLALGLAGTVVAFAGSWNVSLWTDEAATISASRRTLGELWSLLGQLDAVHGTYYLFVHFWSGLFGYSPMALRFPSAVAAGAAVVGVYYLSRSLASGRAAVLAGVVAIVLPRITWMGIEARSFGFSAALAVWATVVLLIALRRGRWFWALYTLLIAAGIAFNIYVAMLGLAHLATVLLLRSLSWRRRLEWAVAGAIGALIASPIVIVSSGQQGQLGDNAITLSTVVRRVFVNQWFLGETPTRVSATSDGFSAWAVTSVLLAVVGWALMLLVVVDALGRGSRAPNVRDPARMALAVLVPWMLVPTGLIVIYSLMINPLYNARYFTFAAPAAAALIGLGVARLARRPLQYIALTLIVVLAAPIYFSQRQVTGKSGTDWSEIASYMAAHARPGDGVYFGPLNPPPGPIYGRNTRNIETAYPDQFVGLIDLTEVSTGAEDNSLRGESRELSASAATIDIVDRIWVIRPVDYPTAEGSADVSLLDSAGFRESTRFTGPMDEVIEFVRG